MAEQSQVSHALLLCQKLEIILDRWGNHLLNFCNTILKFIPTLLLMYFCYSSEFYYSYATADTNNITFFPLPTY